MSYICHHLYIYMTSIWHIYDIYMTYRCAGTLHTHLIHDITSISTWHPNILYMTSIWHIDTPLYLYASYMTMWASYMTSYLCELVVSHEIYAYAQRLMKERFWKVSSTIHVLYTHSLAPHWMSCRHIHDTFTTHSFDVFYTHSCVCVCVCVCVRVWCIEDIEHIHYTL